MHTAIGRGASLRRVAGPAAEALRTSTLSLALVASAAIAAILAYVPVASLRGTAAAGPVLRMAPLPLPDADIRWTPAVRTGSEIQQAAVDDMLSLLIIAATGALVTGILAMLSVSAARAWRRAGELVVRRSVGASRRDLGMSALLEALVVMAAIAFAGLLLATLVTAIGVRTWPGVSTGWRLAAGLALAGTFVAVAVGAVAPVGGAASRGLTDTAERTLPAAIPLLQLGLALVVLAGSVAVLRRAPEVAAEGVAGAPTGTVIAIDASGLPADRRGEALASLVDRVAGVDGVAEVSLTGAGHHAGLGTVDFVKTDCGICPVGGLLLPWRELHAAHFFVSGDTFRTQGARIVAGRSFEAGDSPGADPVAVVNRFMAARYFENGNAVGRDIFVGSGIRSLRHRVIGVVDDARPMAFGGAGLPLEAVYLSVIQHPVGEAELLFRMSGAHGAAGTIAVAHALRATPGLELRAAVTERELRAREAAPVRWFGTAFALQAAAALAIALVGTFTTMALWVRSLAPELALRRAVGASRRRAAAHVVLRAAWVGVRGAIVGAVFIAPVVLPELERLMPGIRAWDVRTLGLLAALLVATALAGAVVPLGRALRTPPAAGLATG